MTGEGVLGKAFERMLMAAGKGDEPSKPLQMDPRCGQLIDRRYLVVEHIASGGMGSVYKATQRPLDRTVAMKFLKLGATHREQLQNRFFLEACLCARLSHPNTVRIFDYGQHDEETFYIVMEHLDGQTLEQVVASEGSIDALRVIRMAMQICAALSEAHEHGLIHRDIKLSNLFLVNQPLMGDFIKVLDFGLVKEVGDNRGETRVGVALGSPLFMSPEQIQGGDVDGRSDIYGLGIAMYIMLTGQPPFRSGRQVGSLFRDHLTSAPPPMSSIRPELDIPEALEAITQSALNKRPEDRYQTMRHMLCALQECEEKIRGRSSMPMGAASVVVPASDGHSAALDLESAILAVTQVAMVDGDGRSLEFEAPMPEAIDTAEPGASVVGDDFLVTADQKALAGLQARDMRDIFLYIDLSCPFCFALHERLCHWGLVDKFSVRMVEHASHVADGSFGVEQEVVLAKEVYALHHRAPDVELSLPPRRFCSKLANRLLYRVQTHHSEHLSTLRSLLYRTVWQEGRDIGDRRVLHDVLSASALPATLLDHCVEAPPVLAEWQVAWEEAGFDCCIPVFQHGPSGRMLIGLPTRRSLLEFLLDKKSRVIDSAVCYYQRRPVVLVYGRMQRLWPLIEPTRNQCDYVPVPSAADAKTSLHARALPDLVLVEDGWGSDEEMTMIGAECRARSVPWIVAASDAPSKGEVNALSAGAAEFLTLADNLQLAQLRFERVLRDRLSIEGRQKEARTDGLTGLASRRRFAQQFEGEWDRACRRQTPISLLLIDIDHFAAFNDTYGYMVGDECLARLAGLWDVVVRRSTDVLARFGGNEVLGMFPERDASQLSSLAERMRALVVEANIEHAQSAHDEKLTVSVGLASCIPDSDASIHELLDLVQEACGEAREGGGNTVVVRTVEPSAVRP